MGGNCNFPPIFYKLLPFKKASKNKLFEMMLIFPSHLSHLLIINPLEWHHPIFPVTPL